MIWIKERDTEIYEKRLETKVAEARYRMGNGMRDNWYWREEEKRMCRMCGNERKSWKNALRGMLRYAS